MPRDHAHFVDQELQSFLLIAEQSTTRATGYAYRALAGILTMMAVNITTDDLKDETLGREAMRDLANDFIRDADAEDERAAAESFGIVGFMGLDSPWLPQYPEYFIP